jgi:hypothetical protein
MFLTEIYKVGKGLAVNNWIFWLLIIFGWWMEDPPSLEPIQRLISSWLCFWCLGGGFNFLGISGNSKHLVKTLNKIGHGAPTFFQNIIFHNPSGRKVMYAEREKRKNKNDVTSTYGLVTANNQIVQ